MPVPEAMGSHTDADAPVSALTDPVAWTSVVRASGHEESGWRAMERPKGEPGNRLRMQTVLHFAGPLLALGKVKPDRLFGFRV